MTDIPAEAIQAAADAERERIRGGLILESLDDLASQSAQNIAEHARCCWPRWQEQLKALAGRLREPAYVGGATLDEDVRDERWRDATS